MSSAQSHLVLYIMQRKRRFGRGSSDMEMMVHDHEG